MMLIKITGESVKCIESKHIQDSLIKTILQLYISYLNKLHSHFIKFDFVNITIGQHLEFRVKIQNDLNKQITTTTESSVP